MRLIGLSVALVVLSGCHGGAPELPALYPVSGKVTDRGKPVGGGALRFYADPDQPTFIVSAVVNPDGTFTASTVRSSGKDEARRPGAPAGTYRLAYYPPSKDQSGTPAVEVPQPVRVEERPNEITVELPGK
jgi:hypothetical protein